MHNKGAKENVNRDATRAWLGIETVRKWVR